MWEELPPAMDQLPPPRPQARGVLRFGGASHYQAPCCRWKQVGNAPSGRTDNDVKNHWNTKLKKRLSGMGIDPVTHKPFSHLMAEIANTLPPPQVAHLAEAALGCFKDEMLHLLTKKRIDFATSGLPQAPPPPPPLPIGSSSDIHGMTYHHTMEDKEDTIQKIKLGLSRAIMQDPNQDKGWAMMGSTGEQANNLDGMCDMYQTEGDGFRYGGSAYGNDREGSAWSQSMCTGSTCTGGGAAEQLLGGLQEKGEDDDGEEAEGGKAGRKGEAGMFSSDCVLWDLSDDLMNPIG